MAWSGLSKLGIALVALAGAVATFMVVMARERAIGAAKEQAKVRRKVIKDVLETNRNKARVRRDRGELDRLHDKYKRD